LIFYKNINKPSFRSIFDSFNTQLMTLPLRSLFTILSNLWNNRFRDISNLNSISTTFNVDWNILYDNSPKKFGLFAFIFTLVVYRWLTLFKRLIIWPFKLGVFSFIYSTLGLDVKWFLGLFDFFYINIPSWVYIQYLTLYNNWLNWWYNTVNIKSLNSVSINKSESENSELSNSHISKHKGKYFLGIISILLFGLIYILFFGDLFPGSGGTPPSTVNIPPVASTSSVTVTEVASSSTGNISSTAIPEPVHIRDNRGVPVNAAVEAMNRSMGTFNYNPSRFWDRSTNPPHYGAPTRVTSWITPSFNRFTVLDQLNPENRAPSPTGSTDSSETITPSRLSSTLESVSDRAGDNDPQD